VQLARRKMATVLVKNAHTALIFIAFMMSFLPEK